MITPKLTAVMVAVTALIGAGPVAAFAQAANVQEIGDLADAAAEGGDAEAEAEAEAESESGDSNSKKKDDHKDGKDGRYSGNGGSESEAEADAEAEAEGGDAEAESGDATAVQLIRGDIENEIEQDAEVDQENELDDRDDVTVTQTNVPIQVQEDPIAADVDLEIILAELLENGAAL